MRLCFRSMLIEYNGTALSRFVIACTRNKYQLHNYSEHIGEIFVKICDYVSKTQSITPDNITNLLSLSEFASIDMIVSVIDNLPLPALQSKIYDILLTRV